MFCFLAFPPSFQHVPYLPKFCSLKSCLPPPPSIRLPSWHSQNLLTHGASCSIRAQGGCGVCKRIWALLQIHARQCKKDRCVGVDLLSRLCSFSILFIPCFVACKYPQGGSLCVPGAVHLFCSHVVPWMNSSFDVSDKYFICCVCFSICADALCRSADNYGNTCATCESSNKPWMTGGDRR